MPDFPNASGVGCLVTDDAGPMTPVLRTKSGQTHPGGNHAQPHYTPAELAALWGVSHHTIRRAFRDLPGVLRIKLGKHQLIRIPASVAASWHEANSGRWDEVKGRRG